MESDNNKTPGTRPEPSAENVIASEERYRMLLAMSPDAIYISQDGIIVEANHAAAALFGLADERDMAGRPLAEFAHPDSRRLIDDRSALLYREEYEAPLVEQKLVRPDGRVIYAEVKSRSFRHRGRLLVQTIARDVTERKQAEQELVRFKRQLEYILEATKTGVVLIDANLDVVYSSPQWKKRLGEVAGRKCYRYFNQADEPCRPCRVLDAIRDRKTLVIEETGMVDPSRTTQVHIVPFQDEAGGWMAAEFSMDITELKKAGNAVRASAQHWQTTFDAINDGIALLDADGVVLRCNTALAGLLQKPCGEIVGSQSCNLLPALDGTGGCDFMERLRQQRQRISQELRDGARWLSLTFDPIPGEGGVLGGSVFILKDITVMRQAEEQTKLMVEAVEQMEEGVMIYDTSDRMIYANPALERITGFSREELMGRRNAVPPQMLTPEFHEYWKRVWESVAADGVWHGSKNSLRKDGTAYEQELVASVVRNQRDEPISYLVVVRDVTDTRRLQSIAEVANNMNNIGFIFSGVRHELGNPVNAIKMTASVLRQEYGGLDDVARLEYIDRVIADVGRLEALLKVLHSFSMFENLSLEHVELAAFFRDLMPTIEPDFRRARIEFTYDFPAAGCTVVADRRALYQVAVNLLTNAFAALEGRARPAIAISAVPGRGRHRLVIADNGGGMSAEVRQNVFKPFYTTKAGGTGLGMVICQKLAMAMNGQVDIESEAGRGTSVTVLLPAALEQASIE